MRTARLLSLGVLLGVAGLLSALAEPALSKKPASRKTLTQQVAATAKLPEKDVEKMLQALGPAIRDQLAAGETVQIDGLGTFRVVRVAEHKDLVGGRPTTIAASNSVEFLPISDLVKASNAASAVPAVEVPAFEYVPLSGRDRGIRTDSSRTPGTRAP